MAKTMRSKILTPTNEAELAGMVREAHMDSKSIEIKGGGTRPIGNPVAAEQLLSTAKISGITLYEPGALTIVAKAGTPLQQVQSELAKEGQHLPFEPVDYCGLLGTKGVSTIGGVVAAAVSGPRRIQTGAVRDSLIGVRFVNGQGIAIKNGGRVMKNVTGVDLVKLLCGSHGTLGVLSEVSFKVLPQPEMTGVVTLHGLDDETAIAALSAALGSPFDISGAAHAPRGRGGSANTMIRVEGFSASINYRTKQLKALLAERLGSKVEITIETDASKTGDMWQWIGQVKAFHNASNPLWRISAKPSDGPKIVAQLQAKIACDAIYDWGGGLVWLSVNDATTDAHAGLIRSAVNFYGGHVTLMRAEESVRDMVEAFHPEHKRVAELSENLRRQFDPKNILNSGRMRRANVLERA